MVSRYMWYLHKHMNRCERETLYALHVVAASSMLWACTGHHVLGLVGQA
jgi:hypothetical protein